MGNLKFFTIGYWDKQTMTPDDSPTSEQRNKVDMICDSLNQKYYTHKICDIHPDKIQKLSVSLRNGLLSILVVPDDTCNCYEALEELNKIADYEIKMYNQGIPRSTDAEV